MRIFNENSALNHNFIADHNDMQSLKWTINNHKPGQCFRAEFNSKEELNKFRNRLTNLYNDKTERVKRGFWLNFKTISETVLEIYKNSGPDSPYKTRLSKP